MINNNTTLYKYTKRKYLDRILSEGSMRIGTLHDFRKEELHGEDVGDKKEGCKTYFKNNKNGLTIVDSGNKEMMPDFLKSKIITEGSNPGRVVILSEGAVSSDFEDDDCFILSFSRTFDRDAMVQFGYDACYEIREPYKFIESLSRKMKKLGKFEYLEECSYTGRYIDHTEGLHHRASLLKEKKHSYQNEIRAVWKPYHKKIKPFIGKFADARKYLFLKPNPFIAETTEHTKETELAYYEAIKYIEGFIPTEHEIASNTSVCTGKEKGEVIYCWKGVPVLTFGRIRDDRYENRFIYKTYLE